MGQENDYPIAYDAEGVMRHMEKRLRHEERRPSVRKAADLLGPGLGPHAVTIDDLDGDVAAFNAIVFAPIGTTNSPDPAKDWIGEVIATAAEGGRQTLSTFRAADSPHETWVRAFNYIPGTTVRVYTPWVQGGGSGGIPVGHVMATAAATAEDGWLLCQGQAVSRTVEAALFAKIGTTYGVGNGTTTFNIPNYKGRVLVGIDTAQTEFDTRGEVGGAKTVSLTAANNGPHRHDWEYSGAGGDGPTVRLVGDPESAGSLGMAFGTLFGTQTFGVGESGSGTPHQNLQPYIAQHYVIKT